MTSDSDVPFIQSVNLLRYGRLEQASIRQREYIALHQRRDGARGELKALVQCAVMTTRAGSESISYAALTYQQAEEFARLALPKAANLGDWQAEATALKVLAQCYARTDYSQWRHFLLRAIRTSRAHREVTHGDPLFDDIADVAIQKGNLRRARLLHEAKLRWLERPSSRDDGDSELQRRHDEYALRGQAATLLDLSFLMLRSGDEIAALQFLQKSAERLATARATVATYADLELAPSQLELPFRSMKEDGAVLAWLYRLQEGGLAREPTPELVAVVWEFRDARRIDHLLFLAERSNGAVGIADALLALARKRHFVLFRDEGSARGLAKQRVRRALRIYLKHGQDLRASSALFEFGLLLTETDSMFYPGRRTTAGRRVMVRALEQLKERPIDEALALARLARVLTHDELHAAEAGALFERAFKTYQQAQAVYTDPNHLLDLASEFNYGLIRAEAENRPRLRTILARALRLLRDAGHERRHAFVILHRFVSEWNAPSVSESKKERYDQLLVEAQVADIEARREDARRDYEEALVIAYEAASYGLEHEVLARLGDMAAWRDDNPAKGFREFEDARFVARAARQTGAKWALASEAYALINLANISVAQGHLKSASAYVRWASKANNSLRSPSLSGNVSETSGWIALGQGARSKARKRLVAAQTHFRTAEDKWGEARCLAKQAVLIESPAERKPLIQRARQLARASRHEVPNRLRQIRVFESLAEVMHEGVDGSRDIEDWPTTGARIVDANRSFLAASVAAAESRWRSAILHANRAIKYAGIVKLHSRRLGSTSTFDAEIVVGSSHILALAYYATERVHKALDALESGRRRMFEEHEIEYRPGPGERQLLSELRNLDRALATRTGQTPGIQRLRERRDAVIQTYATRRMTPMQKRARPERIHALLLTGEMYLTIARVEAPYEGYLIFAVTPRRSRAQFVRQNYLPLKSIRAACSNRDWVRYETALAKLNKGLAKLFPELYRADLQTVFVGTSDDCSLVQFRTLPGPDGRGPDVSVLPSSKFLANRFLRDERPRDLLFVGIGADADPAFPIPCAEQEPQIIANNYYNALGPTRVYAGASANVGSLAALGRSFACVVHFSCHTELNAEDPSQSGFLLFDSAGMATPLTLAQIESQAWIRADIVVLAACSAAAAGPDDPQIASLAQAVMWATGARAVVAPLWPVQDSVTAVLMDALHAHLSSGAEIGSALRRATEEVRDMSIASVERRTMSLQLPPTKRVRSRTAAAAWDFKAHNEGASLRSESGSIGLWGPFALFGDPNARVFV